MSLLNRSNYPTLSESVYLNQASLGLIGQPAVQAMHTFLDATAQHGNLHMSDADEVAFFARLRARAARLMGCKPAKIAIAAGASELLGQLPLLLEISAEKNVVLIASDFPAISRPWLRYANECRCELRFIQDDPTHNLTDSLIAAIDHNTVVVAVGSVQFATGSCCDIFRLREATNRVDAHLIVDVTQAAGVLPMTVDAWQADAVVASGYKWLGGHGGVALGIFSDRLLQQMPPLPGWMGAPDPFDFDATALRFAPDARRYTQSTMSYLSLAGLTVAIERLLQLEVGEGADHARQLASVLIDGAAAKRWRPFRSLSDASAAPHIITLAHPTHQAADTVRHLRQQQIICSARNNRLRVSIAPYNNVQDIAQLVHHLPD